MFIEAEVLITIGLLLAFVIYLAYKVGKNEGSKEVLRRNPDYVKGEKIKEEMRERGQDPYDPDLFLEEWKKANKEEGK